LLTSRRKIGYSISDLLSNFLGMEIEFKWNDIHIIAVK